MNNPLNAIGILALLMVGFTAGLALDRLPGSIALDVGFWHPRVEIPYKSLRTQRDMAVDTARIAGESLKECVVTLGAQSERISRAASLGAAARQELEAQLQAGRDQVADLRRRAASLRAFKPTGATVCQQWESVDAEVQHQLQGASR